MINCSQARFASKSLKLELLIVPVWLKYANRGVLLINSYSNLAGGNFNEYLETIRLVVVLAAEKGIWLIGLQDGNFAPGQPGHYNNQNARKFEQLVEVHKLRFLHDQGAKTHKEYGISHIWTSIPVECASLTSFLICCPNNPDGHNVLLARL